MRVLLFRASLWTSLFLAGLVVFLGGCQTNPVPSGSKKEIRTTLLEYRQAVNQRSVERLSALLGGDIRIGGMTDELSRAGLKAGLAWMPSRVVDLQILSMSQKPGGPEAKAALYMRDSVVVLRFGFDEKLRIRTIDSVPMGNEPSTKVSSTFTSAFKENSGLLFVRATANGRTGYFLLDTGSSNLLLNKKYFSPDPKKEMPGIIATVRGLQPFLGRASLRSFEWGNLRVANVRGQLHDFTVMETPAISPLLGAIGEEQLKNCAVRFDWKNKTVGVRQVGRREAPASVAPRAVIPFTYFLHTPSFPVRIGDRTCAMIFDSGAQINLLPKLDGLESHFRRVDAVTRISDGAKIGNETALLGLIDEISIGSLRCTNQPFAIYEVPYLAGHGILGSPLLQTHPLEVNFPEKTISIW